MVKEASQNKYDAILEREYDSLVIDPSSFSNETDESTIYDLIPLFLIAIVVALFIYFIKKNNIYKKLLPPYNQQIYAFISGWFIWAVCVFSYEMLFDEYVNYMAWLTLPPICIILVFIWLKRFVIK